MDRIREAISRARVEKDIAPVATPAAPAPNLQNATRSIDAKPARDEEEFQYAACNVENFAKHRIISNEQDPILNSYRVLRTRVFQKMEAEGWQTVAVISPGAGAGKTVTAVNLAISMSAKAGINPTLVDLDFYRPSVARYLGLQDSPSILDYFEDKASLKDVTIRTDISNLKIIPNERVTRRGAEHLTSPKFEGLVETAVSSFGSKIVIFDMSPMLGCDDTISVLPKIDCVLIVAASGQTRAPELKETTRLVPASKIVGTVLNKAPVSLMPNPYY